MLHGSNARRYNLSSGIKTAEEGGVAGVVTMALKKSSV